MKTYEMRFNGRRNGAIGINSNFTTQVFAENEEAAKLALYERFEHITLDGKPKEIATPFDGTGLVERVQNTEPEHNSIRRLVTSLRMELDAVATRQARDNANWHDDPDAPDFGLYHSRADYQYPRAMRDFAILELVNRHLDVLNENETASFRRENTVNA